jgi:hypothetical protein
MLAGKAAGALVLAVCTSTPRNTIVASSAAPNYIVTDLAKYAVRWLDYYFRLTSYSPGYLRGGSMTRWRSLSTRQSEFYFYGDAMRLGCGEFLLGMLKIGDVSVSWPRRIENGERFFSSLLVL